MILSCQAAEESLGENENEGRIKRLEEIVGKLADSVTLLVKKKEKNVEARAEVVALQMLVKKKTKEGMCGDSGGASGGRQTVSDMAALVMPFDPKKGEWSTAEWFLNIDQLKDIYGWGETERIYVFQRQLQGTAKT